VRIHRDKPVGGDGPCVLAAAQRRSSFRQVTFIQRVFTYGDQAPANVTPADGDTASVPYTALYVF
jgi:Protein of unknown function (DUF3455)